MIELLNAWDLMFILGAATALAFMRVWGYL